MRTRPACVAAQNRRLRTARGRSGTDQRVDALQRFMDEEANPSSGLDAGKGALVVLFLVTMIDMIGFGIVIPFLTYLVEDLAIDQNITAIGLWVGLLMTSYSAAQFLFSPIWGGLSDRIGRRPVLMIGLVGNTIFFTMFGLASTLLMALAARFMAGVFRFRL